MLQEYKDKIAASKLYWKTGGEEGAIADLRDADLRDANLMDADLRDANLRGADLTCADLREANLMRANLREADLTYANLREARLRGADLMGADLREADLREADLRGAHLTGAHLMGAKLAEMPNPPGQDLFKILMAHTQSDNFDQNNWCGTHCCLGGAAGATIGNQSAGVALIKIVMPEFDLNALYQSDPDVAIAALKAVEHIYGGT